MNDHTLQLSYTQYVGPYVFTVMVGPLGIAVQVRLKEDDDFDLKEDDDFES